MSKIITPIDLAKQESVRQETQAVIERAQVIFEQEFDNIEVSFDLKGKALKTIGTILFLMKSRITYQTACMA